MKHKKYQNSKYVKNSKNFESTQHLTSKEIDYDISFTPFKNVQHSQH